ncbi:MAG: hypothetical protein HZA52_20210, partial [Planctomycetes bacterium]|nr:hypothetical protein [Planctomycetota bacterium]
MLTRFLGPLAVCLAAGTTSAQTPISGPLSDATTGPLLAGTVYHATTSLSVSPGATLTIQPGVIVKFVGQGSTFEVFGTLLCQGTTPSPVIFTDLADDSAGGDTNGDGMSSGTPGHWTYMRFYATANASVLDHTEVRYAGYGTWGGI